MKGPDVKPIYQAPVEATPPTENIEKMNGETMKKYKVMTPT
jgi:hypothetical protein